VFGVLLLRVEREGKMAIDLFLKVDGVKGESKDARHPDEIEVLGYEFSARQTGAPKFGGGGGAGKGEVSSFSVWKNLDRASPPLLLLLLNGKHLPEVVLTARKAGTTPIEFLKVTMKTCAITDISETAGETWGEASEGGPLTREEVTIAFATMKVEYTPQKADGSADAPVSMGWDLVKNKAIS
jgi:type VI secretion system secreted protein Hcp